MALTPELRSPQGGSFVVVRQSAQIEYVTQGGSFTVYNVPAEFVNSAGAFTDVVYSQISQSLNVAQAGTMAVVRGRIDNPKLRAWYYTLDGHDYYILKLGTTGKTLIYDLTTNTWSWWTNGGLGNWRASIGMNWRSAGSIPSNYGTNVIVGDDSYGVLWVLDPMQGVDDSILPGDQVTFERVATGQMVTRDRNFLPVYSVDLTASLGGPALEVNSVKLEYSDDQGHTYVVADEPQVSVSGNYDQEFSWRSLGLVRSPGRLFRITDNGAFARIDSLNVNE